MSTSSVALYDRVDQEALPPKHERARMLRRASAAVIIIALFSPVLAHARVHAQDTTSANVPGDRWSRATAAYSSRRFLEASDVFRDIVETTPRNADALTNWGTAAWAAGDTVSAVIAWQRATRLDPMAQDLRERLALLPSGAREGLADVPYIPVSALLSGGVVAWVLGWLMLALLVLRSRSAGGALPFLKRGAQVVLAAGALSVAVAVWGANELRATNLAVVTRPETIRSAPDAGADALGGAATGDVVRIAQRQDTWTRVRHADGRDGWLPTERLFALTDERLAP